jgi:small-conductance mechanosensitive channel
MARHRLLLGLLSALVLATVVQAKPAAHTAPAAPLPVLAQSASLDQDQATLSALETQAKAPKLTESDLAGLGSQLAPVQSDLATNLAALKDRRDAAQAQLASLGPAPHAPAPPEAPALAQVRTDQTALAAALQAAIERAGLLQVEADQFDDALVRRRVDNLSRRLSAKSPSVLAPAVWIQLAEELPTDLARLAAVARDEWAMVQRAAWWLPLGGAAMTLLLAAILTWPARWGLERLSERLAARRISSNPLRKSELAVVSAVLRTALPLAAAAVAVWGLDWAGLLSPRLLKLGWAGVRAVVFASAAGAIGGAILAPNRPKRRLAPIGDATAQRLAPYPFLLGAVTALGAWLLAANRIFDAGPAAALTSRCLIALAHIAAFALTLSAAGRARAAEEKIAAAAATDPAAPPRRGPQALVVLLLWLALGVAAAALVTGYLAFALFAVEELTWGMMVLAAAWLATELSDDLFQAFAPEGGAIGRFAVSGMGLTPRTLDQLSVLFAGLAKLIVWLAAWSAVLAPFGAGADDLFAHLGAGSTTFRLGGVTISPLAIAAALGLFVLGLFITRLFRRWLETRYLPKTRLDPSLAATVTTAVSYVGGVIALMVAVSYAGIQLSQITLIASALSVGIGFGLQSVIQNFVAGLILLAGRSIRVGDWISVGGQDGDVQRVNVRATEIRMADKSVLIVPNSDLVSKTVRNVTWNDPTGVVAINFTLGYEIDPDQVSTLVLDVLSATPGVLKDPAPSVALTEFKDTGQAFSATAYVASPRAVFRAKSDILFELSRRLRAAGITPGGVARTATVESAASLTPAPAPAPPPESSGLAGRPPGSARPGAPSP